MKGVLERFAWRVWRGQAGLAGVAARIALLPFEGVWRLVTRARNRRHDLGGSKTIEGLPVVSVGNVAVGGTGKTPVSAWVVTALTEAGRKPSLLLRGYGGDEVELHRVWNPDVPVEVDADRVRAAEEARAKGCDVAVVDDGFQHRALGRVLDIVLLAAEDPIPGAVLPRGPYREPLSSLRRADVVVVTRRSGARALAESRAETLRQRALVSEGVTSAGVRLAADGAVPLQAWAAWVEGRPVADLIGGGDAPAEEECRVPSGEATPWDASEGVLAVTAIARSHAFRADVVDFTGAAVELLSYPDHHSFSAHDARSARVLAGRRPIFVTEKDAVKLRSHAEELGDAWVVRQRLAWDWGERDVRRRLEAVFGDGAGEGP